MRDSESGTETDKLEGDVEPDGLLALETFEWVGGGGEVFVAGEVEDFGGDAIRLQCLDSHDKEEACKNATGNEM